ncbi:MAG: transaldolase [Cyclobacteriaceae bacterium]|jgi:transaldolase
MENQMLKKISELGQSVWLDNLSRQILNNGELESLITKMGVRGLTSNPAIFQKAISGSDAYDEAIVKYTSEGLDRKAIYERMAVEDIQRAADLFRPVYDASNGEDGCVSLEVQPALVYDTEGTVEEGRRLWNAVNRPNVMIKVPGTKEGLPAITQLLSEGINVNVTLLFSVERYKDVTEAYLDGLQLRLDQGGSIKDIVSVASFFLSRIDVMVDPLLEDIIEHKPDQAEKAKSVLGKTAIANAKMAYKVFQEVFSSERYQKLAQHGARKQRVLWASTGNKNPDYEELRYVYPLIGPDTVNTMPDQTLDVLLEKGKDLANTVADGMAEAQQVMDTLAELGIGMKKITDDLEKEGVDKFEKPFDQLLDTIEEQRKAHA